MKKLLAVLLIATAVLTSCSKTNEAPPPPQSPPPSVEVKEPQPLPQAQEKPRLPGALCVMVDNYYKARPQSGLDKADLVYEILAEGGITRYLALFYQEPAEKIGPIRSARYYFVQLARGYDAPFAHAGGNADALALIPKIGVKDLDEIYNAGGYFWRDNNRQMPHNLYSSTEKLLAGAQAKGYKLIPPSLPVGSTWEGIAHKPEITFDYSSGKYTYQVSWVYENQRYTRKINGKPHLMEDGAPIAADNLIAMVAPTREVVKEELESEIKLIGKGEARYFIDGKMMKGSWEKPSPERNIRFLDEKGQPVKFKPGKTWVQVLPGWGKLT
ncbi:MAG: hypothetical protein JG781_564 [Peptococcaceae bacterium]|jgi:hypothetical protein|nr:hypothetical protein [Peptococcaceae bacterium]